jgi:hypothetical protein
VLAGICDVPSIATANAALEEFEAKVSYPSNHVPVGPLHFSLNFIELRHQGDMARAFLCNLVLQ